MRFVVCTLFLVGACSSTPDGRQEDAAPDAADSDPAADTGSDFSSISDVDAIPADLSIEVREETRFPDVQDLHGDAPMPDAADSKAAGETVEIEELLSDEVDSGEKCPTIEQGQQAGLVESSQLGEISGLVASRKNEGVLWVHNDSGDSARLFAMGTTGIHLGIYELDGAGAVDWEDIALGPGPEADTDYLFAGDIGDNGKNRDSVRVYRVSEPEVSAVQAPVSVLLTDTATIELTYPDDKAYDAETLLVDPQSRDIYIVVKVGEPNSMVFRAPAPHDPESTTELEFAGTVQFELATAGDISPSGHSIILRNYFQGSLWFRPKEAGMADALATPSCPIPVVFEQQGEALAFAHDESGYYTVSEGANPPLYWYEME